MDATRFDSQENLNELEEPLTLLRPVTGNLSRDRMLFEAGRARAEAGSRLRFLMLALGALVVIVGLGMFSFVERSKRRALEVAIAGLEQRREAPASSFAPPVLIASNDVSPYSYRALSLLENPAGLHEWGPTAGALEPARARTGMETEQTPLRVRDAGKLLEF
jgi:hypothetical protein